MGNINYIKILKEIRRIFDNNKIPIWLEDGTLLGAYRDKKIIRGDEFDIDLGILKSSISKKSIRKKLSKELQKKGYSTVFFWDVINLIKDKIGIDVVLIHNSKNNKYLFKFRERSDGIKFREFIRWLHKLSSIEYYTDFSKNDKLKFFKIINFIPKPLIKIIYSIAKSVFHKNLKPNIYTLKIPSSYFLELKSLNFYDIKFNIPSDVEKYLVLNYGAWDKPVAKNWNWRNFGNWVKNPPL